MDLMGQGETSAQEAQLTAIVNTDNVDIVNANSPLTRSELPAYQSCLLIVDCHLTCGRENFQRRLFTLIATASSL